MSIRTLKISKENPPSYRRVRPSPTSPVTKMEMTTAKTVAVFAIIFGCFACLYPKIFHPMLTHLFGGTPKKERNEDICKKTFNLHTNVLLKLGNWFEIEIEIEKVLLLHFYSKKCYAIYKIIQISLLSPFIHTSLSHIHIHNGCQRTGTAKYSIQHFLYY